MTTLAQKLRLMYEGENEYRKGELTFFGFALAFVAVGAAVIFAAGMATIWISRTVGRTTCNNWSAQTGVDTKFATLSFFSSGVCLAKTQDGHWIINSKWQAFVPAGTP